MIEKDNKNEKIETTQNNKSKNNFDNNNKKSNMTNNDNSQNKNTKQPKKEFVIKPGMSFKEVLDHYSPIEETKPVKIIELCKGGRMSDIKKIPKQALDYLNESLKKDEFDPKTYFVLLTYPWDDAKTI